MQTMTTCLWFDGNAEDAAKFYLSVFKKKAKIISKAYYGAAGPGKNGSLMTVVFKINNQEFLGLNGGPYFKFNEAVSIVVNCDTQKEIDYYWEALSAGGEKSQCGWLKDKFGLSWQVSPKGWEKLYNAKDPSKSERAMRAMLKMQKLDIKALKKAFDGR